MRGHKFNKNRICEVCGRPEAPDQVDDFCFPIGPTKDTVFPTPNEQPLKPQLDHRIKKTVELNGTFTKEDLQNIIDTWGN